MNQAYFEQDFQGLQSNWGIVFSSKRSLSEFEQCLSDREPVLTDRLMGQYEKEMAQFISDADDEWLQLLTKEYVFASGDNVRTFISAHRALPEILVEAVKELRRCFGDAPIFRLELLEDEDVPDTVYGFVLWKDSLESARAALKNFDETWWFENSRKAAGRIVFDYQLA